MHQNQYTQSLVLPLAEGYSISIGTVNVTDPSMTVVVVRTPKGKIDLALDTIQVTDLRFALGESLRQKGVTAG